jgi:glycosyltransferase involved in cell wall biosynthesis
VTGRLLDISRLVSRVGSGPMTGVDRVELAYFRKLLTDSEPVWFLCRLPKSYALLDRAGGVELIGRICGKYLWGRAGFAWILAYSSSQSQQRAIADVWRHAIGKSSEKRLGAMLKRHTSGSISYFNVGHSNLRAEVFQAISEIENSSISIFIHDLIPITSSKYSTMDRNMGFQKSLANISKYASAIIYNSKATKLEAEAWFSSHGRIPRGIVAHLGMSTRRSKILIASPSEKVKFVFLGTIEPRKNHEMILRIWQRFHRDMPEKDIPDLHIIGRRGWQNEVVFDILDSDSMIGKHVFEHNNLDDSDAQKLLSRCTALLFPSFAEGFGLPLIEAASLGVPIICGENDIYREILGDYPLYLNVDNSYVWEKEILERAGRNRESEAERQARAGTVKIPTWDEHFDRIFRFV